MTSEKERDLSGSFCLFLEAYIVLIVLDLSTISTREISVRSLAEQSPRRGAKELLCSDFPPFVRFVSFPFRPRPFSRFS